MSPLLRVFTCLTFDCEAVWAVAILALLFYTYQKYVCILLLLFSPSRNSV